MTPRGRYHFGMSEQSTPAPPVQTAPLLIDTAEAAALLGVSQAHARRLADAGQVPGCVRLGRCRRWNRAELLGWISEGCPRR